MAQKFLTNIELTQGLKDSSGDLGSSGQVLSSTGTGLNWIDSTVNSSVVYQDGFTGDGTTTAFTLANTIDNENKTQVYLDGVYQHKDTYSLSGTTLTFSTAPQNSSDIEVISFASITADGDILTDSEFSSAGLMKTNGSGTYSIVTDNSTNWNTAYTYSQVGHLPLAGGSLTGNMVMGGNQIKFADAGRLYLGDSNDLQIFHNGTDSIIYNGTGALMARANDFRIQSSDASSTKLIVNSSGNVGIGLTSPDTKLDVKKGVQSDTVSIANAAAYLNGLDVGIIVGQSASGPYGTWIQSIRRSDGASFPISLNPSGSGVGIGTTSPQRKLHLHEGSSGNSLISFTNTTTGSSSTNGLLLGLDSSENFLISSYYSGTNIILKTQNSERMRITTGGNVGIGSTSPTSPLVVVGTGVGASGTISVQGANAHVGFKNSSGTFRSWVGHFNAAGHGSDADLNLKTGYGSVGNIRFTADGDTTAAQMFLQGSTGNVGVGTDSPSTKLEVLSSQSNSSIRTGGLEMQSYAVNNSWYAENLYYDGAWKLRNNGHATQIYMEAGVISFKRVASGSAGASVSPLTTMVLASSGNVGIGTTSPSYKLQVSGAQNANDIVINNTTTGVNLRLQMIDAYGFMFTTGSKDLLLGTNNTERMRIDSSGNATFTKDVTLGDTSSDHRSLSIQTNSEKNSVINLKEGSANYGFSIGYYGVANDFIIKRHDNSASGTDVLTLFRENNNATFAGSVGIGTTSPSTKLDVRGGNIMVGGFGGGTDYGLILTPDDGSGYWNIANVTGGALTFNNSNTIGSSEAMRITGGNVGIGTTSPAQPLSVHGNFLVRTTNADGNKNRMQCIVGGSSDAANLYLYHGNSGDGTVSVRINAQGDSYFNGGDVGIGTTTPLARLDVAGNTNQQHSASTANNGAFKNIQNLGVAGWLDQTYSAGRIKVFGYENGNVNVSYCEYYVIRSSTGYHIQQIGTRLDVGNTHGHIECQVSGNFLQVRNVAQSSLGIVRVVFSGMKN